MGVLVEVGVFVGVDVAKGVLVGVGVCVGVCGVADAASVGLSVWVGVEVSVGVARGDCGVVIGTGDSVGRGVPPRVLVAVLVGVGVGVRVAVAVDSRVRRDAMPASCGLALPQAYDNIAQLAQTKQYAKMMTA
ncbi:MAG: hypothetical protein V3S14_03305 [Anaerolineae bacterium]